MEVHCVGCSLEQCCEACFIQNLLRHKVSVDVQVNTAYYFSRNHRAESLATSGRGELAQRAVLKAGSQLQGYPRKTLTKSWYQVG